MLTLRETFKKNKFQISINMLALSDSIKKLRIIHNHRYINPFKKNNELLYVQLDEFIIALTANVLSDALSVA